jgi:uncharacterized protein HemY
VLAPIFTLTGFWYVYPWSYTFKAMGPLLGLHPNGDFTDLKYITYEMNLYISLTTAVITVAIFTFLLKMVSKKVQL